MENKRFELTPEQRDQIIKRSREAQAFLRSFLYSELDKWVEQEKTLAIEGIIANSRSKDDESLSRIEFVEKMAAYYRALATVLGVIRGFALQEEQVKQLPVKADEER